MAYGFAPAMIGYLRIVTSKEDRMHLPWEGATRTAARTHAIAFCLALAAGCGGSAGDDAVADTAVDTNIDPGTDPGPGTGIIPPYRRTAWRPGVPGGIPSVDVACPAGAPSVLEFGAAGDGSTDDREAFAAAIEAAPEGGSILIPAGTYLLLSGLTIDKGVVLCGEGPDLSRLEFETDDLGIDIVTYERGDWVAVVSGLDRWSTSIVVEDGSSFPSGTFAELQQDNDWAVMDPAGEWRDASWVPEAAVGQMFLVTAVDGNTLTVEPQVHLSYNPAMNPVIRPLGLVEGAGLQGLHLERVDASDAGTIEMKNAAGCWMRDSASEMTSQSHVSMTSAIRCEVRDSYFHDSYDHGGGGHGYGVNLGSHVTDCLVENNVFVHLRHSMLVQVGASGNVFGYNFSTDPYQSEGGDWTPCDISLHGHYAHMNLFEANVVQEIDVSDYWGPCGPGNTFFRDRVMAEGIEIMDYAHGQNVVGNELGSDPNVVSIDGTVADTLVHGNLEDGAVSWDPAIADHDLPPSLYLPGRPTFFGDDTWPATGSDVAGSGDTIPAERRWLDM